MNRSDRGDRRVTFWVTPLQQGILDSLAGVHGGFQAAFDALVHGARPDLVALAEKNAKERAAWGREMARRAADVAARKRNNPP